MTIYFLIFLYPILAYFFLSKNVFYLDTVAYIFFALILIIVIGLRYEVGGDWEVYESINLLYRSVEGLPFFDLFQSKYLSQEFGYIFLNWIGFNLGYGITTTNTLVAIIFVLGLFKFANYTQNRWLALVISIPYMVTVVSMGYTRQSAALGLVMIGLVLLNKAKIGKFFFIILLATLFHKSALAVSILGFRNFAVKTKNHRNPLTTILFFLSFVAISSYVFMDYLQNKILLYILDPHTSSSGAFIRISISFVAAIFFIVYKKEWAQKFNDTKIWNLFSWLIVLSLFLFVFNLSVVVDRLAIYALPLQMIVFSRLPFFVENINLKFLLIILIIFFYFLTHYVWLELGSYSPFWVPYKNFLFS